MASFDSLVRKAFRVAAVSLLLFCLAFGVGSSWGRGGFVFAFSRSSAPYSDHSSKLTGFLKGWEIGVVRLPRLKRVMRPGGFVSLF